MLSGLLIRSPYVDWILAGSKTWEIRGSSTKARPHRPDSKRNRDCNRGG